MTAAGPIQALLEAEKRTKKEMRERQNSAVAQAAARRSSVQVVEAETTPRDSVLGAAAFQRRASSSGAGARVSVSGTNSRVNALARPTESSNIRKSMADQDLRQVEQAAARRRSLREGPEAVNAVMAMAAEAPKAVEAEETEEQKQKWDSFHRRSSAFLESKTKQLEALRKKQEQQQIEGCTFEPNATKPNKKIRGSRPSQQRPSSSSLYERSLEAEARKEERLRKRRQEVYDKEMAQCSFHPNSNDGPGSTGPAAAPRRRSVSSQGTTSTRASITSVPGSAVSNGMPAYPRRSSSKPGAPAVGYSGGAPKQGFQPPPRRGSGPVGYRPVSEQRLSINYFDGLDDRTQLASEKVFDRDNEEDEDITTLLPPGMEEYREQAHREPQTLNELLARRASALPPEDAASSGTPSQADSAQPAREPAAENLKVLERLQNRRQLLKETLETQESNGRGGRLAGAGPGSGVPRPPADHGMRREAAGAEVCITCGSELTPDARFCGKCGTKVNKESPPVSQPSYPTSGVSKSVSAAVERMQDLLLGGRDGKHGPDQDWEEEETDEDSEEEAFSEDYDPNDEMDNEDNEEVSAEAPIFGRGSILDSASSHNAPGARGAAAFAKALGRQSQRHEDIPALQIPQHQR